MKTFFLTALCLALVAIGAAQQRDADPGTQNVIPARFEGQKFESLAMGKDCHTLDDYLRGCVCYPTECIKLRVQGTEVVEFVVTPEGTLTAFYVINSLSPEIDAHVISLLKKTSGMWTPGKIGNREVPMRTEVSIVFKWQDYEDQTPLDFKQLAKVQFDKGVRHLLVNHKHEKALKHFNDGIRYLPKNEALLMLRGICRYELGDENGALNDWERLKMLENSRSEFQQYAESLNIYKGYDKLSQIMIE
jgi:tetratricopeptide (TPR) repeat protein